MVVCMSVTHVFHSSSSSPGPPLSIERIRGKLCASTRAHCLCCMSFIFHKPFPIGCSECWLQKVSSLVWCRIIFCCEAAVDSRQSSPHCGAFHLLRAEK